MYCEDSTGVIQPMKYASFNNLADAYKRDLGFAYSFIDRGERRKDGEPYQVLLFSNGADGSSYEGVGYMLTRHLDGLAVRKSYEQFGDEPMKEREGTELCMFVTMISMKGFSDPNSDEAAELPKSEEPHSYGDIGRRRADEEARQRRITEHQNRVRCYANASLPC